MRGYVQLLKRAAAAALIVAAAGFSWGVCSTPENGAAAAAAAADAAAAAEPPSPPKLSGEKLAELMQLSLDEIKRRMELIFDFIDKDNDNIISLQEAEAWGQVLKESMHRHQVKQEFISIDKDADGKITLQELEITYTDGTDAANHNTHKEEVQKRFAAVDKDQSGDLSLEEVTILMDPGKDPTLMQIEVQEIMAAQDKDKDGSISLEEFLTNEGSNLTESERLELSREFGEYDKDGDGKIDEAELRDVIADPHSGELKDMMHALSKEMEGGEKIRKEDWIERFESFSISMLTDNGELLRFPEDYDGLNLPFKGISLSDGGSDEDKVEGRDEL